MSKTLDTASLSETFIQFQIQIEKEEIQDFEEEICQLEDKKKNLIKLQEQLREEHRGCVHELQKKMKEQEKKLEQRQRENEEQVKSMARENLELKHKQEKELEGTGMRSLDAAINENEQKVAQSLKDGIQLAFERANENMGNMGKLQIRDMKKQVSLYKEKVAVLESTIHKLEEEILDLVFLSPGNEFPAQSASLGSHGTHNMDGNIMKISPEETSELVDRPQYPLQPLTEVEGAPQKSNVTASGSTTNVPPEMFSGHGFHGADTSGFTGAEAAVGDWCTHL